MIINIKNMVGRHDEIIVSNILNRLRLNVTYVTSGQVKLRGRVLQYQLRMLDNTLKEEGLEIIIAKKTLLVQKVKNLIYEMVYCDDEPLPVKFSGYLSQRLHYSYTYLSAIFSHECHMSIERYLIEQRIEKVKMLITTHWVLSNIACKMNYSSVSHLSTQFKKVTGITASEYKFLQEREVMRLRA